MYISHSRHPGRPAAGLLGPWFCALLTICALVTSCTEPAPLVDPCDGEVGTCVTLDVQGMVGNLDSIQFTLTGEFTHQFTWPSPGGAGPLPVAVAVPIPQATAGTLLVSAVGSLSGVRVASGQGSLVVTPAMHQQLTVQMTPLSGPLCTNGLKEPNESDVDCGDACPPCGTGKTCSDPQDCQSQVCKGGTCAAPACTDHIKNGDETDVDCGGDVCPACGKGQGCTRPTDCEDLLFCITGVCVPASCMDKARDGHETDVDCGGTDCAPCGDGKMCTGPTDCQSRYCPGGTCATANCTDHVKNGNETDVDCGGGTCPACTVGQTCLKPTDCKNSTCVGGVCTQATCSDAMKDGSETDVDCGGPVCMKCPPGKGCTKGSDCTTGSCCTSGGCAMNKCLGPPTITSVAPASGPVAGGITLAIHGSGFYSGAGLAVTVDGGAASGVSLVSSTQVNATLPAHPAGCGVVNLVLTNPDGQSATTHFTYTCATLSFKKMGPFAVGTGPKELAVGDWNGDGVPDAACTNYGLLSDGNTVSVLLGQGDGSFGTATSFSVGTGDYGITSGDWNGDGRLDLATANYSSGTGTTASVLLGQGTGGFAAQASYATGTGPHSIAAADFNGDTRPDLVTVGTSSTSGSVSVLLNKGTGTFATAKTITVGVSTNFVLAGDWNGDGRSDLAVSDDVNSVVYLLAGKGDGTFGTATSAGGLTGPWGMATGDLNGDGKPDLVVANNGDTFTSGTTISVLLGNGNGTFQGAASYTVGSEPIAVAVADLNGDGKPDVVAVNNGGTTVSVLLGKGDGTLQAQQTFAAGIAPRDVAVADLDGDGRPDLLVTGNSSNDVTVLLNTSH